MANSCSFIVDEVLFTDYRCFWEFIRNNNIQTRIIIIEEAKYSKFGLPTTLQYLDDLKEMGFNYNDYAMVGSSIHIDIGSIIGTNHHIITFCMAVRYLWEGYYKESPNYNHDYFFKIVEYYFKLLDLYPSNSKLELLCVAHNMFFIKQRDKFNSNHCWTSKFGCKLVTNLDGLSNTRKYIETIMVYDYFTEPYKESERWNAKNIEILYKFLKNT